ncbi:MAG: hypothetical protein M3Y56_16765, partial [Armatimonadota bacterium]|nr:hypothetical protein [Armatimonadota bacterium]
MLKVDRFLTVYPLLQYQTKKSASLYLTVLAMCLGTVLISLLAVYNVVIALAVVGPLVFMAVAWRWPAAALMFAYAAAPFQNDLSMGGGAKYAVGEAALALCFPIFVLQNLVRRRSMSSGP